MFTGTKKQILELIKRYGAVSVDKTVSHTTLSRTTLREHFLQLERDGYIERNYLRSGPGRPALQYRLTKKGNSLYPSYEPELIKELLAFLKKQGAEKTIESFFESFWEERLEKAQFRMDSHSEKDLKKKLEGLAEMLEEEGFMPDFSLNEDENTLTVKECNCPFREVIKETRLPCKLEAIFFKNIFGEQTERTTYIADGDYACTYEIGLDK
ncbi:MAG: winged helix-turn-helix transcriptional regulator [Balneolaceae bacterium]